jgi:hypothetical protein
MRDFVQQLQKLLLSIVSAVVLALLGWVWNAEGRITRMDAVIAVNAAEVSAVRATQEALKDQSTDIALIKQDVGYLRSTVDDVKALVKEQGR